MNHDPDTDRNFSLSQNTNVNLGPGDFSCKLSLCSKITDIFVAKKKKKKKEIVHWTLCSWKSSMKFSLLDISFNDVWADTKYILRINCRISSIHTQGAICWTLLIVSHETCLSTLTFFWCFAGDSFQASPITLPYLPCNWVSWFLKKVWVLPSLALKRNSNNESPRDCVRESWSHIQLLITEKLS